MIYVRDARPSDAPDMFSLIEALAIHENALDLLQAKPEDLSIALSDFRLRGLVAEHEDQIIGCITYSWEYLLWANSKLIRIDDVVVRENFRRAGVGKQLMRTIARMAVDSDAQVRWEVEVGNDAAQEFYGVLGANLRTKVVAKWVLASTQKFLST